MDELKRHLHTLKGGARMAGIAAMGNLSHELETLLISVDKRTGQRRLRLSKNCCNKASTSCIACGTR